MIQTGVFDFSFFFDINNISSLLTTEMLIIC